MAPAIEKGSPLLGSARLSASMLLLLPPVLNAELSPGSVGPVPADEAMKLLLPARFVALLPKPVAMREFPVPPMLNALLRLPSADTALLLPALTATLPKPGVPRSLPAKAPGGLPVALGPVVLLPTLTARLPKSPGLAPAIA